VGALATIKKEEEKEQESCSLSGIYSILVGTHRNVGVISKILQRCRMCPPPHVGASKEEEGVNVVRK